MIVYITTSKGVNVVYDDIVKVIDKGSTVKLVDDIGFCIKYKKIEFEKILIEKD